MTMPKPYPTVVRFHDFTFSRAGSPLNWKLRYAQEQLTKEDLLGAASIIDCYDALIFKTEKERNYICGVLKKHPIVDEEDL